MTVTIQNHVYPAPCEPMDSVTAAELTASAEQLIACLPTEYSTSSVRRGRIRPVIDGLMAGGVRPGAVPGWLLVIMALIELLPEIVAIIQRIIDAINGGQTPAEVLAEIRN